MSSTHSSDIYRCDSNPFKGVLRIMGRLSIKFIRDRGTTNRWRNRAPFSGWFGAYSRTLYSAENVLISIWTPLASRQCPNLKLFAHWRSKCVYRPTGLHVMYDGVRFEFHRRSHMLMQCRCGRWQQLLLKQFGEIATETIHQVWTGYCARKVA